MAEPTGVWGASAEIACLQPLMPEVDGATLLYNTDLKVRCRCRHLPQLSPPPGEVAAG